MKTKRSGDGEVRRRRHCGGGTRSHSVAAGRNAASSADRQSVMPRSISWSSVIKFGSGYPTAQVRQPGVCRDVADVKPPVQPSATVVQRGKAMPGGEECRRNKPRPSSPKGRRRHGDGDAEWFRMATWYHRRLVRVRVPAAVHVGSRPAATGAVKTE